MPTNKQEKLDGYVSVTEVIGFFIPKKLLDWYLKTGKKEANRIGKEAMKIGSLVDEKIQHHINTQEIEKEFESQEIANCMKAWYDFDNDYCIKFVTQIEVKDEVNKIVGHIDLLSDDTLVDIKCAGSIKDNYWLQVAEYNSMLSEPRPNIGILRLDKNLGCYQYVVRQDWRELQKIFSGLHDAYRYYNPSKAEEKENTDE